MVMEKNEELVVVPKNLEMLQRDDLETFFEDLKRLGNPFGRRVPITGQADGQQESAMKVEDFVRTDTGETRKKVTWEKSLSRDDFTRIHDMAKRHNGFWSRFAKGMLFDSEENANAFMQEARSIMGGVKYSLRGTGGASEVKYSILKGVTRELDLSNGLPRNYLAPDDMKIQIIDIKENDTKKMTLFELDNIIDKLPLSIHNDQLGQDFTISRRSKEKIKSNLANSDVPIDVFAVSARELPTLFRLSKLGNSHSDIKHKRENCLQIHRFYSAFTYKGKDYAVKITTKEQINPNDLKLYSIQPNKIEVSEIKNPPRTSNSGWVSVMENHTLLAGAPAASKKTYPGSALR